MNEKSILITGSSSGIGAALARRLAKPGVSLMLHARKAKDALESVTDEARQSAAKVEYVLGDLAEEGMAESLIAKTVDSFGTLDAVVANAGFPLIKSFAEGNQADIEYAFRANTFSLFALARSAQKQIEESDCGRLVALGSFTSHVFRSDMPQFPMSAASKGAIEVAVKSLALEFASSGATVNCVVPGYIEKDAGTSDGLGEEKLRELQALIPAGRIGKADEVAGVIEFLLGPDAAYVNGQIIHVNGGLV